MKDLQERINAKADDQLQTSLAKAVKQFRDSAIMRSNMNVQISVQQFIDGRSVPITIRMTASELLEVLRKAIEDDRRDDVRNIETEKYMRALQGLMEGDQ